jgi:hypothetical protein
MVLDSGSQSINRSFGGTSVNGRKIDELIGLCKGILADGKVDRAESEYLQLWLRNNRDISRHWPTNVLYERIGEMLEDDVLDSDEEKKLIEQLVHLLEFDS